MNSESISDWIVGAMVAVFGLIGLLMAIRARDTEIFIFGASLAVFAGVFINDLRRRHGAAPAPKEGSTHG
jgi:hypothetical protein